MWKKKEHIKGKSIFVWFFLWVWGGKDGANANTERKKSMLREILYRQIEWNLWGINRREISLR